MKEKKEKKHKIAHWVFNGYLDDHERIVHIAHKHILVYKLDAAKTSFFGITLPIISFIFFPKFYLIFLIWAFIGVCALFYHFVDWYYDVWLLTNLGIIDIEMRGWLDVTATRVEYHMIEGTSYTIKGFWQTLFNYGDITVDKLGAQTSVCLHDAASPKKLERLVMKLQEKYVYDRSIRDHYALKSMLSDMIAYHIQNKKISNPKKH